MRRLLVFLLFPACACGSTYLAEPSPFDPNREDCSTVDRLLEGYAVNTPIPVPFVGPRDVTLWTGKPEGWDEFVGTVHLRRLSWNIDWISNGSIQIDGLTVARLDDGRWMTNPDIDLTSAIEAVDGDRLKFTAKLKGRGVKPSGRPLIVTTVRAAFCGVGHEAVADGFAALEDWGIE